MKITFEANSYDDMQMINTWLTLALGTNKLIYQRMPTSLDDFELTVKQRKILRENNIDTVCLLLAMTEKQLLMLPRISHHDLAYIKDELAKFGLDLSK